MDQILAVGQARPFGHGSGTDGTRGFGAILTLSKACGAYGCRRRRGLS